MQITAEALKKSPADLRIMVEMIGDRAADCGLGRAKITRLVLRSFTAEKILELFRIQNDPDFKTAIMAELRRLTGEPEIGPLFEQEGSPWRPRLK